MTVIFSKDCLTTLMLKGKEINVNFTIDTYSNHKNCKKHISDL